jgi:pimeloyl-ACP methyl ester carboxylesterase
MLVVKIMVALAAVYAVVVALAYFAQTAMLFPAGMAGGGPTALPPGGKQLAIPTTDGEELVALHLPASDGAGRARPLVLGFGGNAWNAEVMALLLHRLLPDHAVVVPYYRGYPPSSGRPSASALMADALIVYDHLAAPAAIIVVGFSIGAGIAAHLAAERPVIGLVLVTPFDSLTGLTRYHYPWLPVTQLLRHRIETAQLLRNVVAPTAVITAEHDTIVPVGRSEPVHKATSHLVYRTTVSGAGHNDLYDRSEFAEAMRTAIGRILANEGAARM